MALKNWMLLVLTVVMLGGCVETQTTSYSIENKLPSKIQMQLEQQQSSEITGLKLFSNNKDTYYIIYDSTKKVEGFPRVYETDSNNVIIKIFDGEELDERTRYIFKIKRNTTFESITIEKNGLPSSFDLVGSY